MFGQWIPRGGYTLYSWSVPLRHAFDVLWSPLNGFFIWSPLALTGMVGLCATAGEKDAVPRAAARMGVCMVLLYAGFYGSWQAWWGGASTIGQRFLIPLAPCIAFGIARIWMQAASLRMGVRIAVRAGIIFLAGASVVLALAHWYGPRPLDLVLI
jgi:hypothetical protein